jgi:hypothetical protein
MLLILLFKFVTLKSWEDLLISCLTWHVEDCYLKFEVWKSHISFLFFLLASAFIQMSSCFMLARDAVCFALWIMSDVDYIWTQSDEYSDKEIVIIACYLKVLINLSVLLLNDILRISMSECRELIWNFTEKKKIMYLMLMKNLKDWNRIISWIYILLKWVALSGPTRKPDPTRPEPAKTPLRVHMASNLYPAGWSGPKL